MLSSNLRNFSVILRFVAIYALYGRLWAKKLLFWVKNSAYCILYWIKFAILQIRKNEAFVAKIASMRLTKNFVAIFWEAATLVQTNRKSRKGHIDIGALFVLEERVLVINVNMQGCRVSDGRSNRPSGLFALPLS